LLQKKHDRSRKNLFGKNFADRFHGKSGAMNYRTISQWGFIGSALIVPIPVPGSVNADILSLELKLTPGAFPVIFD
jgi:hypothetical protein